MKSPGHVPGLFCEVSMDRNVEKEIKKFNYLLPKSLKNRLLFISVPLIHFEMTHYYRVHGRDILGYMEQSKDLYNFAEKYIRLEKMISEFGQSNSPYQFIAHRKDYYWIWVDIAALRMLGFDTRDLRPCHA